VLGAGLLAALTLLGSVSFLIGLILLGIAYSALRRYGPMMVAAVERRVYVARCLRCGRSGPAHEDGVDAKQAFEDTFEEGC